MTETGWIIIGIIALIAIILVAVMMLRKPAGTLPAATAAPKEVLPEQVTPEPPVAPVAVASLVEEVVPVPVSAPPAPEPETPVIPVAEASVAAVTAAPVASGEADNLLKLKGVGPKIATLLASEGITRFAQIAAWSDADLAAIDTKLGSFAGRPKRDNWIDQARFLAAGDTAGYEAKYGKL